jgi:hypothetical protein
MNQYVSHWKRSGGHALTAERTVTRQMPDTREAYRIV